MSAPKKQKIEKKKVLCLGAGLVTAPGVRYMCEAGLDVTVASRTLSKAEALFKDGISGKAVQLDVTDDTQQDKLEKLVQENDLIISLLPWTQHLPICKMALKYKKHFATTSYISDDMQKLDADFKSAGVLCFNECGVDPGLDHMSAKKIIDEVHSEGGKIDSFLSYCGGLPCPDDNNNPYGYKFSWSPRGVLLAAKRVAKYLEEGKEKTLDGEPGSMIYDVFLTDSSVENVGPPLKGDWPSSFESHPNGDSLKYIDIYGIPEVKTLIRGTFRTTGWCPTMKIVTMLGLLKEDDVSSFVGKTYLDFSVNLLGLSADSTAADCKAAIAGKFKLQVDDPILGRLEWLGLFDNEKKVSKATRIDALCDLFFDNKKFWYTEGERDMICMKHTFTVSNKDGTKDEITSTLIDYGVKDGDTSMSRTVSLPLAIMIRRILSGQTEGLEGVCRPTSKAVYMPVLEEMSEKFAITFVESKKRL